MDSSIVWLMVFFCSLTGPCKGLTPSTGPFDSFKACQEAGYHFQQAWLPRHRDWHQGGIVCSVEKP